MVKELGTIFAFCIVIDAQISSAVNILTRKIIHGFIISLISLSSKKKIGIKTR